MAFAERPYAPSGSSQFNFPVAVKWLLVSNTAIFVVFYLANAFGFGWLFTPFKLVPAKVVELQLWQLVTYLFLHLNFQHIIYNMLSLWFFGADLEYAWGTQKFLKYYFFCGIGAGITVVVANYLLPAGAPYSSTIGASGAIFGLILAFVLMDPERIVNFNFLFPIKAKYMGLIIGGVTFLLTITDTGGGVSHFAHLGGALWGFIFLKSRLGQQPTRFGRSQPGLLEKAQQSYKQWKLDRARKKFQVYMNKNRKN